MLENERTSGERPLRSAILHALPSASLLLLMLWTALFAIGWAMPTAIGGSIWAFAAIAPLVIIAGLYATFKIVVMCVASERPYDQ